MSAQIGEPLVLLLIDQVQQLDREPLDVAEVGDRDQIVVVSLEQLETLGGARDEESFLFIAPDGGLDQDREIAVVVVDRLHVPNIPAGPDSLRDSSGLLEVMLLNARMVTEAWIAAFR